MCVRVSVCERAMLADFLNAPKATWKELANYLDWSKKENNKKTNPKKHCYHLKEDFLFLWQVLIIVQ